MKLLKLPKNRSLISELAYIALNVGLAVALFAIVLGIKSPLPAFALVLLSKWRILAVRPRFWFANIQSNMVDIIVGLSVVVLLYTATSFMVQLLLAVFYGVWLLLIKPRSKRHFVAAQAGMAIFLGVTALFTVSYDWYVSVVVLCMWVIGYTGARHVLSSYRESERTFYGMIWGLVLAEIGWLGYHWAFAYNLPGLSGILLSQTAIVALALSFLAQRAYDSYHHNEGAIRSADLLLPALFTGGIILVILFAFNTISTGTI